MPVNMMGTDPMVAQAASSAMKESAATRRTSIQTSSNEELNRVQAAVSLSIEREKEKGKERDRQLTGMLTQQHEGALQERFDASLKFNRDYLTMTTEERRKFREDENRRQDRDFFQVQQDKKTNTKMILTQFKTMMEQGKITDTKVHSILKKQQDQDNAQLRTKRHSKEALKQGQMANSTLRDAITDISSDSSEEVLNKHSRKLMQNMADVVNKASDGQIKIEELLGRPEALAEKVSSGELTENHLAQIIHGMDSFKQGIGETFVDLKGYDDDMPKDLVAFLLSGDTTTEGVRRHFGPEFVEDTGVQGWKKRVLSIGDLVTGKEKRKYPQQVTEKGEAKLKSMRSKAQGADIATSLEKLINNTTGTLTTSLNNLLSHKDPKVRGAMEKALAIAEGGGSLGDLSEFMDDDSMTFDIDGALDTLNQQRTNEFIFRYQDMVDHDEVDRAEALREQFKLLGGGDLYELINP